MPFGLVQSVFGPLAPVLPTSGCVDGLPPTLGAAAGGEVGFICSDPWETKGALLPHQPRRNSPTEMKGELHPAGISGGTSTPTHHRVEETPPTCSEHLSGSQLQTCTWRLL